MSARERSRRFTSPIPPTISAEPAEHEVCVGYRRLGPAQSIASRAGRCARAARTDMQRALLDPRGRKLRAFRGECKSIRRRSTSVLSV